MIGQTLAAATDTLSGHSDSPRLDAELLLAHVLGLSRGQLHARDRDALPPEKATEYRRLLERRQSGEPVSYLTGRREFWTLNLHVDPRVLVPRPETERLVELALACLHERPHPRILDLGTGSGAIGLALASERPDAEVTLTDASANALSVAAHNASRLGLPRVRLLEGPWFEPIGESRFDAIVSNPPYLAEDDPHGSSRELSFEPPEALTSGRTGLEALATIAAGAAAHLTPGGWLLLEHGHTQGAAVRDLLRQGGLERTETHRDLAGLERATIGRRPD
jgi:release factor glutamine methyltransferase